MKIRTFGSEWNRGTVRQFCCNTQIEKVADYNQFTGMKTFFTQDTYHTPPDLPQHWLDVLSLGTRAFFTLSFIRIVLVSAQISRKGLYDREMWVSSSLDVLHLIESCKGKFHITGIDNIRNLQEPVVYVSNHMSTLETMIFPGIIASMHEATFVVKDSLVKHRFFGPVMRARNPIVVSRSNSREDLITVLSQGQEMLKNGISVIIFPQSTRSTTFKPSEFNTLGVKLASKAGAKVVPIAIKTDFWENGRWVKDLGPIYRKRPIHIAIGQPITVEGSGKETHSAVVSFIEGHLKEWEAAVLEA